MGIPAYFSHIIKEHRVILKEISNKSFGKTTHLFLDSNSIIYDIIRSQEYDPKNTEFENESIMEICKQIQYYISMINPSKFIMICFDGVAPVAKLKQQQTRRYKNDYLRQRFPKESPEWNTSAITPGTEFMKNLSSTVKDYFANNPKVLVSGSDEFGEGEHKIFEWIRKNKHNLTDAKSIVYGLDSDLIMLALLHLKYCKELYLFRETPHFIKSIDRTLNPNELYALDIPIMQERITRAMKTVPAKNAITDYVFISFLLGNDFIPHMPALNIRTNGIDRIFDAYNSAISKKGSITKNGKINWPMFKKFLEFLAKNEYTYIKYEYTIREKQEKRVARLQHTRTPEEKWDNIPCINRAVEHYINPDDDGWQWRYYKSLLDVDTQLFSSKKICINYLEALEWTLHYYTLGCKNQRWLYNYHYAPLLEDLYRSAPSFAVDFVKENFNPITSQSQLAFVLPESCAHLLTKEMREKMKEHYERNRDASFSWAFCKYFWEGHIHLEGIPLFG